MATLVAGTQLRGSFSEKLNALKDEVKRADGRVVVFIDEIHTLVGAGSTGEGPQDAANELKSGDGARRVPLHRRHHARRVPQVHLRRIPALERRFTAGGGATSPRVPETVEILQGVIGRYEEHHGLRYAPEALEAAASLASRYVTDRFLPDKAISRGGPRRLALPPRGQGRGGALGRGARGGEARRHARGAPADERLGAAAAAGGGPRRSASSATRRPIGAHRPGHPPQLRGLRLAPADGLASSSWAPRAWARRRWRARWPRCSSAAATRWCAWT